MKKSLEWWIFTLLPLILFFVFIGLFYLNNEIFPTLNFVQQLSFYSLVLVSTEIALVSKKNKSFNIGWGYLAGLFSLIILCITYLTQNLFEKFPILFLVLSFVFGIFSFTFIYNIGEDNFKTDFAKQKESSFNEFNKSIKPKKYYKDIRI